MKIHFLFSPQYESALGGRAVGVPKEVKALEKRWKKREKAVISAFKDITGLEFQDSYIDCYINSRKSLSSPLSVKIENLDDMFDSLVHELIHQLVWQNYHTIKKPWDAFGTKSKKSGHKQVVWVHVIIHSVHYLVMERVFGKGARLKRIVAYSKEKDYRKSWDIVLAREPQTVVDEVFEK